MTRMLHAEFLKMRRSRMPLWTALVVLIVAGLAAFIYPMLSDPGTQAEMAKMGGAYGRAVALGHYDATWSNYLRITLQGMSGSWGVLTFALVASYVFARESSEGTLDAMLTLPTRREYIVAAKMVVVAVWVAGLALLSIVLTAIVTAALRVDGFAWSYLAKNAADTLKVAFLLFVTLPFVAWFAMSGKGYLRPMLFALATMMVGDGLVGTPVSPWLPWNMPLHLVGASWYPVPPTGMPSAGWLVALAVFAAGIAACMWRIDRAESPA